MFPERSKRFSKKTVRPRFGCARHPPSEEWLLPPSPPEPSETLWSLCMGEMPWGRHVLPLPAEGPALPSVSDPSSSPLDPDSGRKRKRKVCLWLLPSMLMGSGLLELEF